MLVHFPRKTFVRGRNHLKFLFFGRTGRQSVVVGRAKPYVPVHRVRQYKGLFIFVITVACYGAFSHKPFDFSEITVLRLSMVVFTPLLLVGFILFTQPGRGEKS